MKQYGLIQTVCLAAVALGVAACSQDELLTSNEGVEGAAVTFTATGITMPQVETRATTDGTWEDTQSVGIRISGTTKEYAVTPNSADPTKATLSVAEGSTSFYWTSATETKNVEAWYPYTDGQTTMPNVVVQQNQSVEANYVASDLLSAAQTVTYGDTDLQFTHRTAKITLNISAAEEGILDNAKVMLCNLSTANGNPSSIRCLNTSAGGSYTYQALVSPQTFAANTEFFKIILGNGHVHAYYPTAAVEFKEGCQYLFDVEVSDLRLIVTPSGEMPWTSGNSGTGTLKRVNLSDGDYYLESGSLRSYHVGTEAGLRAWAEYVKEGNANANCTLLNDINLTKNADGSNNWPEIYNYTGTFDGAGHQIDNITLNKKDTQRELSGFIVRSTGTIKNLSIGENSVFSASGNGVGSIVSRLEEGGKIINCHSKASLYGINSFTGGIVGIVYARVSALGCHIVGCSFSGNIDMEGESNSFYVGGIAGSTYCEQNGSVGDNHLYAINMIGCYNIGKISVKGYNVIVGGLVGRSRIVPSGYGTYIGCYSTEGMTSVEGTDFVGGLMGYMWIGSAAHYLSSCYWSNYTGNGVGYLEGGSTDNSSMGFVDNAAINWTTATTNMNAAIKEWNAKSGNMCQWHYEQKNGENEPPILVDGVPQ